MPNPQDNDPIALHPIAQDIRPNARHLAFSVPRVATTVRKLHEAVGQRDKPFSQPLRGGGIENRNISDDCFELTDGLVGPDDPMQINRRRAGAAVALRFPRIAANAAPPNG